MPEIAETLGLRRPSGALVANVVSGSPAARAGLKPSDLIVAIEGQAVDDPNAFDYRFATRPLGGTADIEVQRAGKPVKLTVTEFLLLQSLAQRPGFVKSRDNLMDAAYDDQVYVDDRTIDSHIKRLRKKFKVVDDDFEMIETLYGVGYRFKET